MPRGLAVLAVALLVSLPRAGAAGELQLRLGGFWPGADSNLFDDDEELYTVGEGDWTGGTGGAEYAWRLTPRMHLGLHLDGYGRTVHTNYRDFTGESGREIRQSLKLNIVPLGVTLKFVPFDRRREFGPYVGVGADVIFYKYEEYGEFIDFETSDIIPDDFISEGAAPGLHVVGGLRVPITDDVSLLGEGRYQWAKADMGDDFRGNRIDLGGFGLTVGVLLRF
jgi:hypothetical protein